MTVLRKTHDYANIFKSISKNFTNQISDIAPHSETFATIMNNSHGTHIIYHFLWLTV